MEIKIYNSFTNKIETFVPLHEGEVSMYVCGPTVYNYPHIGNMRPVVVFDTLRRFFEYVGYKVTYVSNFTNVDDKIIKEAIKENKSEHDLTEFYINEFKNTSIAIGSRLPDITPKVTEYIDSIIKYIEELIKVDAAYIKGDDVYFRISKIEDYGTLSGINIQDLMVGARIEENTNKENPLDFVLWKKTDEGINWPSPWGRGRPGWHTECCVMIDTIFPDHIIDIHGGGYDLKFPHHENEIAQAEATHHNHIARYWMHNAFVNFNNTKMSKSLGNVIYAKDMINEFGGPVTRLVILSTHYRQPVNYTEDTIKAAQQEINKLEMVYRQLSLKLQSNDVDLSLGQPQFIDKFLTALADDLNTSNAMSELFEIVKLSNQELRSSNPDLAKLNDYFKTLGDMFSILGLDIHYVTMSTEDKQIYSAYLLSKQNKDFALSDKLRTVLIERKIM